MRFNYICQHVCGESQRDMINTIDKRPERNTGFFSGWPSFRWQRDVQCAKLKQWLH